MVAFAPEEVKVIGAVEYGQPTPVTQYTGHPRVQAYGFNARPGDRIEVTLDTKAPGLKAYLTDAHFRSLAGGKGHFSADIPGSKPATFYVAITGESGHSAEYSLDLERPSRK